MRERVIKSFSLSRMPLTPSAFESLLTLALTFSVVTFPPADFLREPPSLSLFPSPYLARPAPMLSWLASCVVLERLMCM